MSEETFHEKVKSELKKLNKKQKIDFAWRCAIRALPLLGADGNFDFWDKKNKQKHLYAIFYALDVASCVNVGIGIKGAANALDASNDAAYAASNDASNAVSAASAASNAAYTIAYDAAYDASNASNADRYLNSIILQDLKNIQDKELPQISTELYGGIWTNFQKALKEIGCEYWGKLYQNIFDNQFQLDKKALKKRINIEPSIRAQGASAVANFLEEMEKKGAIRLNEARIIILGDKGAGKTCIARRLINPDAPMTSINESTPGVDTTNWPLKDENINVRIWDFAGHTITHAVHQFFLSERCLYLLVYNGRTDDINRLKYWLDHMKNYGKDSKAIIFVNEFDHHSVNIPINLLKEKYPIEQLYSFSIKDNKKALMTFRDDVAAFIKHDPSWENQKIPISYYQVKEDLEQLFIKGEKEKTQEYISRERFNQIAKKHKVDNVEELLKNLHCLGISLWYESMEQFNTLVLNPEWISHGVYKIINWVNHEKKYSLTLDDFEAVFNKKIVIPKKNMNSFLI